MAAEVGASREVLADFVALDDISATEWRAKLREERVIVKQLHSMISVLPNGGTPSLGSGFLRSSCTR